MNKARTDGGSTPLYIACYQGHIEAVKALLACDEIDVNKARTDDGPTPLYTACNQGHSGVVKALLACDEIDVNNARTDGGSTPLFTACDQGHIGAVKALLARDDIDVHKARADCGTTPLGTAYANGRTGTAKLLLACKRIDVNQIVYIVEGVGTTLFSAACAGGNVEIITALLMHDELDLGEPSLEEDGGMAGFLRACDEGHAGVVQLLLSDGRVNTNGPVMYRGEMQTVLHVATFKGHLKVTQVLVVYGANRAATDDEGNTPAQLAQQYGPIALREWHTATASWSQLQVAAGCRLYNEAATALKRGLIDPDDPTTDFRESIPAAIKTARMGPDALPWGGAPPVCRATTKLVVDATRGWHRTTHWLHHKHVRGTVFAVLVVALRLDEKDERTALSPPPRRQTRAAVAEDKRLNGAPQLPLLPIEMWFSALRFCKRSWWAVPVE